MSLIFFQFKTFKTMVYTYDSFCVGNILYFMLYFWRRWIQKG